MQTISIILCCIVGSIIGAVLIGGFTSVTLTVLGALVGAVLGWLLGKFIPWYEWFT